MSEAENQFIETIQDVVDRENNVPEEHKKGKAFINENAMKAMIRIGDLCKNNNIKLNDLECKDHNIKLVLNPKSGIECLINLTYDIDKKSKKAIPAIRINNDPINDNLNEVKTIGEDYIYAILLEEITKFYKSC